jgi:hypothetical protein
VCVSQAIREATFREEPSAQYSQYKRRRLLRLHRGRLPRSQYYEDCVGALAELEIKLERNRFQYASVLSNPKMTLTRGGTA